MSKKEWFSKGRSNYDNVADEEGTTAFTGDGGSSVVEDPLQMDRYWIPGDEAGEEKYVYLLDEDPYNAWMHKFPINGTWKYRLPCPVQNSDGEFSERCVFCERADDKLPGKAGYARWISHYTIVDLTGWEDDDGNHRKEIRLLEADEDINSSFDIKARTEGTVEGSVWIVKRSKKDGKSVGNTWEFIERKPVDDFLEDNLEQIRGSLNRLPEEWGFYEGDGDDRTYDLHPLPYPEIIAEGMMTFEEQVEYLRQKDDSFAESYDVSGAGGGGGGNASQGNTNDVNY